VDTVFRPELQKNKDLERSTESKNCDPLEEQIIGFKKQVPQRQLAYLGGVTRQGAVTQQQCQARRPEREPAAGQRLRRRPAAARR
jgi:hypothetical protein